MTPYAKPLKLTCHDVGCDRAGLAIVRGVSFSLDCGEAIQIFGANGTGKSTLLSVISGRSAPAEGDVQWRDVEGGNVTGAPRNGITILDHEGALKPTLSVMENLKFWRTLYGKTPAEQKAVLHEVGLEAQASQRAGTLSAGQRRRLSLARLILADRSVWLLDEPVTSIDESGVTAVTELITAHLQRGGLALIATHQELALSGKRLRLG